ncbi:hypothetical protein [Ralstonia sp. 1138]|uniref:hypothetical protein n=1 Tax=Ralstonia sp. 1138 TaxID=3156423 RepID=UPI003395BB5F
MENPAAAPFFTKNGNKTGGLSTTWPKEGVPLGGSKEKGTEIAFRPHFSPFFLPVYARRQKKMPVRSFPRPAYPLPLLSCLSPCAFLLCVPALLFFVLLCADLAGYSAIPVFPVLLPVFPVRLF